MSEPVIAENDLILDDIEVSEKLVENWQITADLLSQIAPIPAALIMRVQRNHIAVGC